MTRSKLLALTLAVVLCALTGCVPAGTTSSPRMRVGPLNTQNLLTLAVTHGRLDAAVSSAGATLQVTAPFPAFAPAAEAVKAGQLDMTSGSVTSLVTALQANPGLVVFAAETNDNDTQGIVAAPGSGITSVAGLRGRTVAVNQGGTGDYLLRLALERAGMTVADVEPVYLGPADAATAFASGRVDAWATWDQYLAAAQLTPGATTVALARDLGAHNLTVHVVSRDVLTASPKVVVAAYDALVDQAEALATDRGVLAEAYVRSGATREVAQAVAAKSPPRVVPADSQVRRSVGSVAQFYAEQGLIEQVGDVTGVVVDVSTLR